MFDLLNMRLQTQRRSSVRVQDLAHFGSKPRSHFALDPLSVEKRVSEPGQEADCIAWRA